MGKFWREGGVFIGGRAIAPPPRGRPTEAGSGARMGTHAHARMGTLTGAQVRTRSTHARARKPDVRLCNPAI